MAVAGEATSLVGVASVVGEAARCDASHCFATTSYDEIATDTRQSCNQQRQLLVHHSFLLDAEKMRVVTGVQRSCNQHHKCYDQRLFLLEPESRAADQRVKKLQPASPNATTGILKSYICHLEKLQQETRKLASASAAQPRKVATSS